MATAKTPKLQKSKPKTTIREIIIIYYDRIHYFSLLRLVIKHTNISYNFDQVTK